MTSSGQGTVHVQFHHALVVDPDDRAVEPDADTIPQGPMAPLSGGVGARIYTGIHTGTIAYTWTVHPEQPPADDPWPEEAQAAIGVPHGRLVVDDMFTENVDAPVIEVDPPGSWMLRVRYRDRQAEWDAAPEGDVAVETFHLDLWPAQTQDA